MENTPVFNTNNHLRRQRLHELLIALIHQQVDLELMDSEEPNLNSLNSPQSIEMDPGRWIERNRRIIKKYQSLVRSAVALDALLDSENINSTSDGNN